MEENVITIIGLGYVGLPLAIAFAKRYKVIGYDINSQRIKELSEGKDITLEVSKSEILELLNKNLTFSNHLSDIKRANIYIVTVPTPIDEHKIPDLNPLIEASRLVASVLKKGDIVIYESTVFPGCTEEICVPELERNSGLVYNKDFFCGYSPERVNPGDKVHTIDRIKKITSGSTPQIAKIIDDLYSSIISAGTHPVSSIRVAEAAKVIENAQRDINIAFVNELSIIFNLMDVDTLEVLEASGTKWNFLPFKPGLVGGHCIGVDPYYLTFKAEGLGYHSEVILSGRRINDYMGKFVAENTVKKLIKADRSVKGSKVLILGFTFKENVPDIRNTKVIDIYRELQDYGIDVYIFDPIAYYDDIKKVYGIEAIKDDNELRYYEPFDAVIVAVKHKVFEEEYSLDKLLQIMGNRDKSIIIDVKGLYDKKEVSNRNVIYWRL